MAIQRPNYLTRKKRSETEAGLRIREMYQIGRSLDWRAFQAGRSILALGTLLTLWTNSRESLFHAQLRDGQSVPKCGGSASLGIFCVGGVDSFTEARLISVLILVAAISGFAPQVTSIGHWWVAFSVQNNAVVTDGGDQVAAAISLILVPVLLTCPRWNLWVPQRSTKNISRRFGTGVKSTVLYHWLMGVRSASIVMLALQVSGIYFVSCVAKFGTVTWTEGTALWYIVQDPIFGLVLTPIFSASRELLSIPLVASLMTWGTLFVEFFLANTTLASAGAVRKVRLGAAIALHAGIIVFLGIGTFGLQMIGVAFLVYAIRAKVVRNISGTGSVKAPTEVAQAS